MKKTLLRLITIVMVLGMVFIAGPVMAGDSANQTVTMAVSAINEITATAGPTLTFNAANIEASGGGSYVVGSDAFQITDATTTYSVTTNSASNKKITAHLDSALTAVGLALNVALASASGGTSGEVAITSAVAVSAVDVVTGLLQEADADQVITYRAVATVATPIANYAPVVTFTLTDQGA